MARLAFLSNINIEPIKIFFKEEETYFTGYNQYALALIDEGSMLYSEKITTVILFIDGEEFLKDLIYKQLPSEQILYGANEKIAELLDIVERYISKRNRVLFFINNIVLPPYSIATYIKNVDVNIFDVESFVNKKIQEMAKRVNNLLLIDWQITVRGRGYYNLHDDKFWYLGRIKLNNKAFSLLAENYRSLLDAYQGKAKKVLVLDLDNTLWGGVIGEDGQNGIQLSEDGSGKIFRDFQTIIKSLKQLGILLCINSKNNESDVNTVFEKHPMMVLKLEDFIVKKINWSDKVQNMHDIAQELDLGVDSFIFIDDNPAEREYVQKSFPGIVVPEFPKDITTLKIWFFESVVYKYFAKTYLGTEDRNKTEQYKAKLQRDTSSRGLSSEEFIKGLEIKLKIRLNPAQYTQRIAQLSQKTNQFNLTTKRYSETEIGRYLRDDTMEVLGLEYEDKFGKEGLIGVAILKINPAGDEADLDTLLLSCRIIGKGVEYAFLNEILRILQRSNKSRIKIEFIPTEKNNVAKTFYDSLLLSNHPCSVDTLVHRLKDKLLIRQIEIV